MEKVLMLLCVLSLPVLFSSCTDVEGDGTGTTIWEGSQVPEETSYRNPVWEPDLGRPSVFRGPTQFYAFGDEKEWSEGLSYNVPVLRSGKLMSWSITGEAFSTRPAWADARISSVSAIFSKTLSTYYMVYCLGDSGIGVAFAKAPQGPYTDYGKLFDKGIQDFEYVREPYFIQSGLGFYVFFETEQGIFGTELNVRLNSKPTLKGVPFKIAGTGITGAYIFRKSSSEYYFFGTVGDKTASDIYMGRASLISGPYLDKNGDNLMNGGGTLLIQGGSENGFTEPGHVGGVFTDNQGKEWILYQATDIGNPLLSSGEERCPMLLSRIEWDENGWPAEVVVAKGGWNTPKFEL